jgi:hypothetical protein
MRYLQLMLFFAVVIVSYHFMGSSLPRVASPVPSTEMEAPIEVVPTEAETVPAEIPNE